jgi:hypothetical protein
MLKEASQMVGQFLTDNQMLKQAYETKAHGHLESAYKAYKGRIYENEYAGDPEKERQFILATLESFVGNDGPLRDFYCGLHQERRENQRQSIVCGITEARRTAQLQERLVKEQTRDQEQARQNKLKTETTTTTTVPEMHAFEDNGKGKEKYKAPEKRVKEKRHFFGPMPKPADPQNEAINAPIRQVISLDADNYYVFQCLTGGTYNRHITLEQVLTLLGKGLHCGFSLAGGSHNKATAPNHQMWTIPPAWNGPIPDHYRSQLMKFLLDKMDIDPDDVVEI